LILLHILTALILKTLINNGFIDYKVILKGGQI